MTETCGVRTYPATRLEPAEYCGQPLAPGSDLCPEHDAEEQAEAYAEDMRFELWKDSRYDD